MLQVSDAEVGLVTKLGLRLAVRANEVREDKPLGTREPRRPHPTFEIVSHEPCDVVDQKSEASIIVRQRFRV